MYQTYPNPYITANQQALQQQLAQQVMAQQSQIVLPPQQVPRIDGKESINQLRMSPNSSILLMENNRAIVWLCTSDGVGNITPTPYDISPHQEEQPDDVDSLEQRVSKLEKILSEINLSGGNDNGAKSDVKPIKSEQNSGVNGESKAVQTANEQPESAQ